LAEAGVVQLNGGINYMILIPWMQLQSRCSILQNSIKEKEISGIVIFQNVDLYYYTGETGPNCFFVPAKGSPILFTRMRGELPSLPWPVKKIKAWGEMLDILKEYEINNFDNIGFEGDVLPAALYINIMSIFKNSKFLDVSSLIRAQRAIKSNWELDIFRETAKKDLNVWSKIPDMIRESKSDFELSAQIESEFRRQGHMGFFRCRGFNFDMSTSLTITGVASAVPTLTEVPLSGNGISQYFPFGSSGQILDYGNPIVVDCGTNYFGYTIDQTRTFAIGELNSKLNNAYNLCLEIQDLIVRNAKIGITCGELYDMAKTMVDKADYTEGFMGASGGVPFIGHGIGLEVDEFPIIRKGSKEIIKEGMVFALEPKFAFSGIGAVGVENCFIVTGNSLERLTLCSDELRIIEV